MRLQWAILNDKRNGSMAPAAGTSSGAWRGRAFGTWSMIVGGLLILALIGLAGIYSHSLAVMPALGNSPFPQELDFVATADLEKDDRNRSPHSPPPLDGTIEQLHMADVVWQIPSDPTGVLFVAHGCNHKATDFWDSSPNCPACYGWPEERNLTLAALARKLAVIAMSSDNLCWDAKWPSKWLAETGVDMKRAILVLKSWRAKKGLDNLPLFGFGASSGGYFLSVLAHRVKFDALAIQIASGVRMAFQNEVIIDDVQQKYPPTLFVHMPRDKRTAAAIEESMSILREKEVEVMDLLSNPRPITHSFFAERILQMDVSKSQQIYNTLKKAGYLDEHGFLIRDPRRFGWKSLLRDAGILRPIPDSSDNSRGARLEYEYDVAEELNVAFGQHELIGDMNDEMLDWFFGVCRLDGESVKRRCTSAVAEREAKQTSD